MANKNTQGGGDASLSNSFNKGMNKDNNETYIGEGLWTHARNAVNNSHDGQIGVIGNEPANLKCIDLPYTLIGAIHLGEDNWALFTTDDVDSEIGIFDESQCSYETVVNDRCLNFNRKNLITGAYRYRYDCEDLIYWEDGRNPTRYMNMGDVPWKETCTLNNNCLTCVPTITNGKKQLDCEKIRIYPLIKQPCILLEKGKMGGTLENGSYQVCIRYLVNNQAVSDYIGLTQVQGIWDHNVTAGSLEVVIKEIDTDFDTFELILLSMINNQTTAKFMGVYSTGTGTIYIDRIDSEAGTVSIDQIVFRSEPLEKADAMFALNGYLMRTGPYSNFKFNYQPQANNIVTSWVSVEYPKDYYYKGGNNTGYMRDEVYPFFIRWIYNTGFKSDSYHIPGRAPLPSDTANNFTTDAFEFAQGLTVQNWQVQNTGSIVSTVPRSLTDGGTVIATGTMGYWESSTESYPDRSPNIWGTLCGEKIRHHKMPDETIIGPTPNHPLNIYKNGGEFIRVLGVEFTNITHPLDLNGNAIENIVGYEILRGSREGNKTVIAKGIFNNLRQYDIPGNPTIKGLFQNYPYNDLSDDVYLTASVQDGDSGADRVNTPPMGGMQYDKYSFHSPDTTFKNPYLSINEIKIYGNVYGNAYGKFEVPYKHPKFKFFTNLSSTVFIVIGLALKLQNWKEVYNIVGTEILGTTFGGQTQKAPKLQYKFTGTEKSPNEFTFGPMDPFPKFPNLIMAGDIWLASAVVAVLVNIVLIAAWVGEAVLWGAELLVMQQLGAAMSDAQSQKIMDIFRALIPKIQNATQYNSHAWYNNFTVSSVNNRRRHIKNFTYVKPSVQAFSDTHQINNIHRSQYLAIGLDINLDKPAVTDNTRFLESSSNFYSNGNGRTRVGRGIQTITTASSHYGAIKIPMPSQYGQLDSIKQLLVSDCMSYTVPNKTLTFNSDVLFGGDIYINRFTEKNTMFFFNSWLMGEPDEFEIDYTAYANIPYPRHWVNTREHLYSVMTIGQTTNGSNPTSTASANRMLDDKDNRGLFYISQGYFYLFNSGVRDFFCESEVNTAYRDYEDPIEKRFYDPYGYSDLISMFRSDVIQFGNFYKYDYSLSVTKLFNSHISWGNILPRDYDPEIADTCYTYSPYRLVYSLPQDDVSKMDSWRMFLINNFKDFPSRLRSVKSINMTGALFMMETSSPMKFLGSEELQLDGTGTKLTIGDGALFTDTNNLQALVNSEESFEYGSNQSRYGTIATQYGIFWVSQDQGKVFNYSSGLNEISQNNMKWWLARYLPSELLKKFPTYPYSDNTVIGIGTQMMYDNTHEILYITKKDWKPVNPALQYNPTTNTFYVPGTPSTSYTCPEGYTLTATNTCTKDCCPTGYTLVNGQCTITRTAEPIPVGDITRITPTPYQAYGTNGVIVYSTPVYQTTATITAALANGTATRLSLTNPFWNFDNSLPQTQAGQLNNGAVNRLSRWGLVNDASGNPYNNYNTPLGAGNLLPINVWTGFTTCLTINNTTTYHVCVAGDNRFRIRVDGVTIIDSSVSSDTFPFSFLHIYPITIIAGSHTLIVEGWNNGALACFAVEIFDLNNLPGGQTVVQYLDAQTDYSNLNPRIIFSTRNATQFTSGTYTCPTGYSATTSGNCTIPTCTLVQTTPVLQCTAPVITNTVENNIPCPFEDEKCFEPASWTISYDPKVKSWISFHDWIPTFMIPGKQHFMTVDDDSIWKHNTRCDLFTNYYGVDYPWEVEFAYSSGQEVVTTRSIEYLLEAYRFYNECKDRFHILDQNFDQAIIYNSEQISGLLNLTLKSKTNPVQMLSYPQIGTNSITIQFSKEENKYRFNQFWDITKDRGEFSGASLPMFNTSPSGYKFDINPLFINYNKPVLERKKFRHHVSNVFLRKNISGDVKFLFKLSNQKVQQSYR